MPYSWVHQDRERNIESELKNSTTAILNLVKTAVTGSIRNYLRTVADRNLKIVEHLHDGDHIKDKLHLKSAAELTVRAVRWSQAE